MLPKQIPPVQTWSQLHHRVSPKELKTEYFSFLCYMLNIRPCQISPSAFHTNSIPQKLSHKQNATRGENQQGQEVELQKTIIYITNVIKMFEKMY